MTKNQSSACFDYCCLNIVLNTFNSNTHQSALKHPLKDCFLTCFVNQRHYHINPIALSQQSITLSTQVISFLDKI